MKGFIEFIKSQGIFGIAIGFIVSTELAKVVTSLVTDILNPLLGELLGFAGNLSEAYFTIGHAKVMWGSFVNSLISFTIIIFIIYILIQIIGLSKKKTA